MIIEFSNKNIINDIKEDFSKIDRISDTQAIAFFDLVGSTGKKLNSGHERGISDSLKAILLFSRCVEQYNGEIVKETGDGILSRFKNSLDAILAGLLSKTLAIDLNIKIKVAITVGMVDLLKLSSDKYDIIGSAVDRCARIESFCLPNQLLIDNPTIELVKSYLKNYENIEIGEGKKRFLRGIGETELFEISTSELGLKKYVYTGFKIHEEGRIPLQDKVNFVKNAQTEVIEIGAGLRTFSKFFSGQRPSEFRNYIENLLVKGVNLKLLVLDPDWEGSKQYFIEIDEEEYREDIFRSLKYLKDEQHRLLKLGLKGEFQIFLYQHIPTMHILCVDAQDDIFGRMCVSPYLYKSPRSECPVIEFSSLSNPELFKKYRESLLNILKYKSELYE